MSQANRDGWRPQQRTHDEEEIHGYIWPCIDNWDEMERLFIVVFEQAILSPSIMVTYHQ
jgi:hypothetical protein